MKDYFVVNGHKVLYQDGLADFTQYHILIRCKPEEFTYAWVLKMSHKLSILTGVL